jgi:hypothetical protein
MKSIAIRIYRTGHGDLFSNPPHGGGPAHHKTPEPFAAPMTWTQDFTRQAQKILVAIVMMLCGAAAKGL